MTCDCWHWWIQCFSDMLPSLSIMLFKLLPLYLIWRIALLSCGTWNINFISCLDLLIYFKHLCRTLYGIFLYLLHTFISSFISVSSANLCTVNSVVISKGLNIGLIQLWSAKDLSLFFRLDVDNFQSYNLSRPIYLHCFWHWEAAKRHLVTYNLCGFGRVSFFSYHIRSFLQV